MRIRQGTTDKYVYFVAVDPTDLKTRETGLTGFTVYYSIDGGAATQMTTPTVNETDSTNMPGVYELLIDESGMTTLTAGDDTAELALHITHGSMQPVTRTVEVYREETTAGQTLTVESDGMGHADVKEWLGSAPNALTGGKVDAQDAIVSGTADSGTTTTMVDAARTEADTDYWKGKLIKFTSGNIAGQVRFIFGFDPATDTISFVPATTQAVGTNTYVILPAGAADVHRWRGVQPNTLVSGAMDADVSAVQTDALNAAALAADAVAEIADGVWDEDIEAAHGTDATAGLLLRALGAAISNRSNNANLNALLGVADAAGEDVPSQVLDGDTLTELSQAAPAATPTLREAMMLLYMAMRNKETQTNALYALYNDAGTLIAKASLSDDGTTTTKDEMVSGP